MPDIMPIETVDANASREAYHTTRRALTTFDAKRLEFSLLNPQYGRYRPEPTQYWPVATWQRRVRETLRGIYGRKALSPAQSKLADQIQAALMARRSNPPSVTLEQRLRKRMRAKYLLEAARRGLPTVLDLGGNGDAEPQVTSEGKDDGHRVAVLHASGWKKYSSAFGVRYQTLSLLCGVDDAGLWAVRIPGTIKEVSEALAWLKPATVRNAITAGRKVLRQGDVWLVERSRDAMANLPSGHRWDADTRTLHHAGHASVQVPFPALAVPQATLAERGSQRRRGD